MPVPHSAAMPGEEALRAGDDAARGEAVPAWLGRRWPWLLILAAACVAPRLLYHLGLFGSDYDDGIYHNLAWNLANGRGFWSDILGRHHLGEHWSPILAAFAPLYRLCPSALWLMAAQGLAIAATLAALLWIADARLVAVPAPRRRAGLLLLAGLALLYPPLWSAWWWDFQPLVLGAPFVAWGMVALERGSARGLAVCAALLLLTRESAPLAVLGLAWYGWRVAGRPRAALALAVAALVVAAAVFALVMPLARGGESWAHAERIGPGAALAAKGGYLLALLGQLAFLPLVAPVAALAALPGIALNLAVAYPAQFSSAYHYDAQIAPFLLAAAAAGLARLLRWRPDADAAWLRWGLPHLVALVLVGLWTRVPLYAYAGRLVDQERGGNAARTIADLQAIVATAGIADDEPIAADPQVGPLLAHRSGYRSLWAGDEACVRDLPPGTRLVVQRWWWEDLAGRVPAVAGLVGAWPEQWNGTMLVLRRK